MTGRLKKRQQILLAVSGAIFAVLFHAEAICTAGIDLHWLWDDRCSACHGHAGDFAREFLSVSDNRLQGRHHVDDFILFLQNHYLAGHEVDAIYNMLLAQVSTQARFRSECSNCHGTAAEFVRNSLDLRNGVLYCRVGNCQVRTFLNNHRGLDPEDVEFFVNVLTRVAHEVYRP